MTLQSMGRGALVLQVALQAVSVWCLSLKVDRRGFGQGALGTAASTLLPPATLVTDAGLAVAAGGDVALKSIEWSATDGFDSDFPSQIDFIEFDEKAYKAMRDDSRRTPKFTKAIKNRLEAFGPGAVVLDLGTGPYAVLALIAARYGAEKVYAVEANPEAARRARDFISKCERPNAGGRDGDGVIPLKPGQVEVIEGFSTSIDLPQKVDLCVFEICGSIASEEGVYATMRDCKSRHMKHPDAPSSYIPQRCQTYAAPVSYALHNLLTPPSSDPGPAVRWGERDN